MGFQVTKQKLLFGLLILNMFLVIIVVLFYLEYDALSAKKLVVQAEQVLLEKQVAEVQELLEIREKATIVKDSNIPKPSFVNNIFQSSAVQKVQSCVRFIVRFFFPPQ